jgi:hypothetical protein
MALMFGNPHVEAARLLKDSGVITDEEFQWVQAEAARWEREQSERLGRANREAAERFRALPWWKRFWRSESEWVRKHRNVWPA